MVAEAGEPEPGAPRRRPSPAGALAVALVFAALAAALLALSWNPEAAGFLSDDAVYLLMADAFSPYRAADPVLADYVLRQSLFPPLYPLLLALAGAGSHALLWSHVVTTGTLVLALGVFGLWIHSQVEDRAAAIGLVVAFGLCPGTLFQNFELLSESPYLLFSALAIWLAARNDASRRSLLLAALCVGLATVTRTAGMSLLLAWVLWSFLHRTPRWFLGIAIAALPSLVWFAYKKWAIGSSGADYSNFWLALWDRLRSDPGYAFRFAADQTRASWFGLSEILDLRPSRLTFAVLAVTLALAIPAWIRRLRERRLDAIYLPIAAGMVWLYPFPNFFARLLLPLVPVVLAYAYFGVLGFTRRWGRLGSRPAVAYACLSAFLVALTPSLGFIVSRLSSPVDPELAHWKHTRYWFRFDEPARIAADVRFRHDLIAAIGEAGALVPQGKCIFSLYTGVSMLFGRHVVYQPPAPDKSDADFARLAAACDYFLVMPVSGEIAGERVGAYYPYERLRGPGIEQQRTWPEAPGNDAPTAMLVRWRAPR